MSDSAEQIRSRIAEAIAQRQSGQSLQQPESKIAETTRRHLPVASRPPIDLNLPPWGMPAMAITTIVAGSALIGLNMVLSRDPELEKQRALTESLQRQQETNAVVASEAVRNAGPRFNFCLGLCNDKQRQQQAGPEPFPTVASFSPTPTPTPEVAATPAAASAPRPWDQGLYDRWFSYYLAAIPPQWEGYVVRQAMVRPSDFDSPEHEKAFRDAFRKVEAMRTQSPQSNNAYRPISQVGRRPCRRGEQIFYF